MYECISLVGETETTQIPRAAMTYDKFVEQKTVDMSSTKDLERKMRIAAFVSVAISTTAIFASMVGIPLFYSYALQVQSVIQHESEFCRVNADN